MLIIFNLPDLLCSCSKWIINIFQLSQLMIKLVMESYLENVPDSSVYKEPFIFKVNKK